MLFWLPSLLAQFDAALDWEAALFDDALDWEDDRGVVAFGRVGMPETTTTDVPGIVTSPRAPGL